MTQPTVSEVGCGPKDKDSIPPSPPHRVTIVQHIMQYEKNTLENVAIANALQLEAARATPTLCRFSYDAVPRLMSPNLSITIL